MRAKVKFSELSDGDVFFAFPTSPLCCGRIIKDGKVAFTDGEVCPVLRDTPWSPDKEVFVEMPSFDQSVKESKTLAYWKAAELDARSMFDANPSRDNYNAVDFAHCKIEQIEKVKFYA